MSDFVTWLREQSYTDQIWAVVVWSCFLYGLLELFLYLKAAFPVEANRGQSEREDLEKAHSHVETMIALETSAAMLWPLRLEVMSLTRRRFSMRNGIRHPFPDWGLVQVMREFDRYESRRNGLSVECRLMVMTQEAELLRKQALSLQRLPELPMGEADWLFGRILSLPSQSDLTPSFRSDDSFSRAVDDLAFVTQCACRETAIAALLIAEYEERFVPTHV